MTDLTVLLTEVSVGIGGLVGLATLITLLLRPLQTKLNNINDKIEVQHDCVKKVETKTSLLEMKIDTVTANLAANAADSKENKLQITILVSKLTEIALDNRDRISRLEGITDKADERRKWTNMAEAQSPREKASDLINEAQNKRDAEKLAAKSKDTDL
jgi:hypothetical protein